MNRYTIYCTEEQTKKALELGAPIKIECFSTATEDNWHKVIPTAEQMIGWLEEQEGVKEIFVTLEYITWYYVIILSSGNAIECNDSYDSRKEATLAAIDAALDYLSNNK